MAPSSTPCIFFQQGRCKNSDSCRFSHASAPAPVSHSQPDPRSRVLCKFHQQGICKRGADCPYQHGPSDASTSAQGPTQRDNDTFIRVFRGALVRYGDGACVTSLSLPSEYSSVRLDGLPANTTPASVINLLQGLGHDIEVDGLRIVPMPQHRSFCSAYISTPDLEFSQTLSTSLIDAPYHNLKAVPVPPRLPSWASTRRARCNKLKLKWTAPCSEGILSFRTRSTALRVSGKFKGGRYRVLDAHVHCEEPRLEPSTGLYSVSIDGLPNQCSAKTVEASITADYDAPTDIVVYRRTGWERKSKTSIEELLRGVGPIDSMTEPYEHDSEYWTASANFEQDSDAQEAARVIEDGSYDLPYNVNLKAKLVYTSTFKVSNEVYHYVQQRLEDYLEEVEESLSVKCQGNRTFLNIDSFSSEEVARCANAVEDIVAGEAVEGKDGLPFWIPQLACNGLATKLLKEIQKRHGVLLLPNRSKHEVRFFGDSSKQVEVQKDMVRSLIDDMGVCHTIDIKDDAFAWLCRSGLDRLRAVVGDKAVSLNVTANPKKLTVTGSDDECRDILHILDKIRIASPAEEAEPEEPCSICFTPAEDPVVLGCGHTYCADCFKELCRNGANQTDISISCPGAEDKCKNAIPLREIRALVDPLTFEQLLESSFNTYIARRPNQFHYCPTPDCGYIYRPAGASGSSSLHMCSKCLKKICRSCRASHDGQSCAEYQVFQSFEGYKQLNRSRVKDCPRCKTTLEKNGGCNHMQCRGCRSHLCWVCLEVFGNPDHCYSHMLEKHGGFGVPEDDNPYLR